MKTMIQEMKSKCTHLGMIKDGTKPHTPGVCEECSKTGDTWVHLRMCMTCGKVGCCENSKNKHASRHAHQENHPIIRSLEKGEEWLWCHVDNAYVERP